MRHARGQSESSLSSETQPAHDIRAEGWARTADAVLQVERVGREVEGVLRPPQLRAGRMGLPVPDGDHAWVAPGEVSESGIRGPLPGER